MKKLIILFVLTLAFTGCAFHETRMVHYYFPNERVYPDDYNRVWTATLQAFEKFPITTIEKESGLISCAPVAFYDVNIYDRAFVPLSFREVVNGTGIYFRDICDNAVIVTVEDGSPAYKAGVREGDIIIEKSDNGNSVTLIVTRDYNHERMVFNNIPKEKISMARAAWLFPQRIHFNVLVKRAQKGTQVRVVANSEVEDYVYKGAQRFATGNWYPTSTSSLPEWSILNNIEKLLKQQ